MAQIDKIQVQSTTYDVAQSASANFTGTSNDTTSPTGWSDVSVLQNTETNASIFTKISKMFANIRWLYNQLGTTDYSATGASTVSSALANLQSGKAASSHSHTTADLPVTDQQNNSSATIPTSSLIYSMNQTLTSLNDAIGGDGKIYCRPDFTKNKPITLSSIGGMACFTIGAHVAIYVYMSSSNLTTVKVTSDTYFDSYIAFNMDNSISNGLIISTTYEYNIRAMVLYC